VVEAFPDFLCRLLADRNMSVRAAARKIGLDHAYLVRVLKGTLSLPAKHVAKTADVLGLGGKERDDFVLAADIMRSPERVRKYIRELELKITNIVV
jgi:hypothetical protein